MIIEKISSIVKDNLYWENDGVGPLDVGGKPVFDKGKTFLACGISMADIKIGSGAIIPTILSDVVLKDGNAFDFVATLQSVSLENKTYKLAYLIEESK